MAMEGVTESRFLMMITPVNVKDNLLYLPQSFVTQRGKEIPWRCYLRVRNGDLFEVHFIKNSHAFVGAHTILQRYRSTSYSFLLFEYMGGADFAMDIFSCYGVEVDYPLPATNESLLRESLSYMHPLFQPTAGVHNFTLLDDIEYELLRYNCMRTNGVSMEILFSSAEMLCSEAGLLLGTEHLHHMQSWEDGSVVIFQIGHRFWPVEISRDSAGFYFRKGWEIVVRDVGLELGDVCVFRKDNSMRKFRLAIYKQRYVFSTAVRPGLLFYRRFVILATPWSISAGEIPLPTLFMRLFGTLLQPEVLVIHSSGKSCTAQFSLNSQSLLGLGPLVRSVNTDIGDLYLFKYTLVGAFYLSIIKEGAPEVLF